jgi:hypothetical protein
MWFRAHARVRAADPIETAAAPEGADTRAVEFARREGELHILAWNEPYAPLVDPDVLGEFIRVFASATPPSDDQIEDFYRRFGAVRDLEWITGLTAEDQGQVSELTRLGLREPVWWVCELASELRVCCELYRGLRDSDVEVLQATLRVAPSTGKLADILLLGGELKKIWATPQEMQRKVGSIGEWVESAEDPGRPMTADECQHWAREILRRQLNRYEARAHRQWVHSAEVPWDALRPDDPLTQAKENPMLGAFRTLTFDSLIVALYLQLSDCVERGDLLRRCQGCDRFFFPARPNQYYCQGKCSDAYRRRKFAARHAKTQREGRAQ